MSRKSRRTVKPSRGLTLDTGFLIALERRKTRAEKVLALYDRDAVTVPAVVLAEWWRGSRRQRELRGFFVIEEIDEQLAELAGLALAHIPQHTANDAIDAIVMASAATRDDVVYTDDFEDLARLRDVYFHGVKVLKV